MKSNLSSHDWQDLSAYLDHELNPSERSNFEKRLQNEAELRATLFDLRRTRAVLRSQPPVRVPAAHDGRRPRCLQKNHRAHGKAARRKA